MNQLIAPSRMPTAGAPRTIGSNNRIPASSAGNTLAASQLSTLRAVKVDPHERIRGALAQLAESMNEFAQGTLTPQNNLVGSSTYTTAMSQLSANFKQEHVGAANGIKDAIRKYTTAARESVGPPVKLIEAITDFNKDILPEFITDMLPAAQGIDMLI
jgi:hypothetical protein